jgi:hypothetical protein
LKSKKGKYVQHIGEDIAKAKPKFVPDGQDTGPVGGKVVFGSKEEALRHARTRLQYGNIFESLKEGRISFEKHKEEQEMLESQMSSLRDTFKETTLFGLWKGKSLDPAFNEFLELAKVQKRLQHNEEHPHAQLDLPKTKKDVETILEFNKQNPANPLPVPAPVSDEVGTYMTNAVNLKKMRGRYGTDDEIKEALDLLVKMKADNAVVLSQQEMALYDKIQHQHNAPAANPGNKEEEIDALHSFVENYQSNIAELEFQLKKIEQDINDKASTYNNAMLALQKKHHEYVDLYENYKALKKAAETPGPSPENIAWAGRINSEVSSKKLDSMKKLIEENEMIINKIQGDLQPLVAIGAEDAPPDPDQNQAVIP